MNIYTNTTFRGHWPVGTAAVVRAETDVEAAELLSEMLKEYGLEQTVMPKDMILFPDHPKAVPVRILNDGDY